MTHFTPFRFYPPNVTKTPLQPATTGALYDPFQIAVARNSGISRSSCTPDKPEEEDPFWYLKDD